MKVGDTLIRRKDTMVAELSGWVKVDRITEIDGIMYTLESGNMFPKEILERLYCVKKDTE